MSFGGNFLIKNPDNGGSIIFAAVLEGTHGNQGQLSRQASS
jgi:hypothetical protein